MALRITVWGNRFLSSYMVTEWVQGRDQDLPFGGGSG